MAVEEALSPQAAYDALHNRLGVYCPGCGMLRLFPKEAKMGDEVLLVPCPSCHQPARFLLTSRGARQLPLIFHRA